MNLWYYPVPIRNKDTFQKEIQNLVEIVVIKPVQQYKRGTPISIIPNKEVTVRLIIYYHRINKQISINKELLYIIGDTMQKMEGL